MSARKANRDGARKRPASPAALDPIHAGIERHRAAYLAWCLAGIPDCDQPYKGNPGHNPALAAANNRAWKVKTRAGLALTTVSPTTIAGVLALLRYLFEREAARDELLLLDALPGPHRRASVALVARLIEALELHHKPG